MSLQRGTATVLDQLSLAIDGDGNVLKTRGEYIAFPRDAEAEIIADKLLELPVETRRDLYLFLVENGDLFTGAPKKEPKYSPPLAPSARRRR